MKQFNKRQGSQCKGNATRSQLSSPRGSLLRQQHCRVSRVQRFETPPHRNGIGICLLGGREAPLLSRSTVLMRETLIFVKDLHPTSQDRKSKMDKQRRTEKQRTTQVNPGIEVDRPIHHQILEPPYLRDDRQPGPKSVERHCSQIDAVDFYGSVVAIQAQQNLEKRRFPRTGSADDTYLAKREQKHQPQNRTVSHCEWT